jgi:hypothetical protein
MTTQEIDSLESTFDSVASEILDALKNNPKYIQIKAKLDLLQSMMQDAIGEEFPDSWMAKLKN